MSKNCYILPITLSEKSFFCFASVETYESAGTIGSILVALCVILITWYFNSFHNMIKQQVKKMNLTKPRHVYTVHLHPGTKGVELYYPDAKKPANTYACDGCSGNSDSSLYDKNSK